MAELTDRALQQAVVAIKKGAHILKCRRTGKPKFCPFRLSTDEKFLIWYSGEEEKQLKLSSVTKIIRGQKTVNFQRQLQPEKESQSFSLIYASGERTLDLICKDESQADVWTIGLRAVISRCHRSRNHCRGVQSCINSPAGYMRRKNNLGLPEEPIKISQVQSVCGSPKSLSGRCYSGGLSYSFDTFYSSESIPSSRQNVNDVSIPNGSYTEDHNVLKDVMTWGEGIEGGYFGHLVNRFSNNNKTQLDALLPKVLDSTGMLDVQQICLGGKHAALVTKQGEVYCWGASLSGVHVDVSHPKIVESLSGVHVKSVACGEYQTCAVSLSGELYTWGESKTRLLPNRYFGPMEGIKISSVSCGEWHTAVVSSAGQLFTYGDGTFGVLGHGDLKSVSQPKEVESLKGLRVKSVACGSWHTAAIVEIMFDRFKSSSLGGKLFTWGDGDKGRLGHSNHERKILPTCVARLVDHDFVQVSCGRMLTVGLTTLGKVYTMGSGVHGQLGNPQAEDKSTTVVEGKLKDEFVKEISSGSYHVAVLTSRGSVYTWGNGANGRLGLGDTHDRNSPTLVEALRDRKVESITCGSSFTAAICLHKSFSIVDQSACSGCRMAFGFTRKKHNCYNCGLLFCRACSSKKIVDASLAPTKNKPFRVCDSCYDSLQRTTNSCQLSRLENHSPRNPLTSHELLSDEKEHEEMVGPIRGQLSNLPNEIKTSKNQENQWPIGLPRWGQVESPSAFEKFYREKPTNQSPISNATNVEKGLPGRDQRLIQEHQRLRAEFINLEKECQMKNEKLRECQRQIEETWLLAREEAAKSKAAKDVITALTTRCYTMSEKLSGEVEKEVKVTVPQSTPGHSPTLHFARKMLMPTHLLPREGGDSLCTTPVVSSEILRSTCATTRNTYDGYTQSIGDPGIQKPDSGQDETKDRKHEWVEQYELGVYITFVALPHGQKGLKRVRFSRKRFTEKEAEKWWVENQMRVYEAYDIDEHATSYQN